MTALPEFWLAWSRKRYAEFRAEKLPSHLSSRIALGEARGRAQLEALVGRKVALCAALVIGEIGSDLKIGLMVDPASG